MKLALRFFVAGHAGARIIMAMLFLLGASPGKALARPIGFLIYTASLSDSRAKTAIGSLRGVRPHQLFMPFLAQTAPDQAVTSFLDVLAKVFLIIGACVLAFAGYQAHQGRIPEALLGLLAGLLIALAIPLMKYFLHLAGVSV